MNHPNPFVPQGSLLELQSKRRSRLKLAVFCVLAVSITGLTAMLIQGCKREQSTEQTELQPPVETNPPIMETNPLPMETSNPPIIPPPMMTNPPVVPPAPGPALVPPPTTAGTEYVVVRGDSLWKIARKFNVSVKAIETANPDVEPARLQVGQKLLIPVPSGGATTETAPSATGTNSGEEIYVVKSGDTLSRIARHYGVTVKAIESENNLLTTRIKVGQRLKIPAKAEITMPAPTQPTPPPETMPALPTSSPSGQ